MLKIFIVLSLLCCISLDITAANHNTVSHINDEDEGDVLNDRPIIGVIAQKAPEILGDDKSYIAASYIKYLEMAGARVVPIFIDQSDEYYEIMVHNINGFMLPGGKQKLVDSGYGKAARRMYKLADDLNADGDHFAIWGTCLGFQLLSTIWADNPHVLCPCGGVQNVILPLNLTTDATSSRLLGKAGDDIIDILQNDDVTSNYHMYCLSKENFTASGMNKELTLISTNDANGLEFVSTLEHKTKPYYATQWHPEKNPFEWKTEMPGIPHTMNAVTIAQYMANYFVKECRKNNHTFSTVEEETKALIYNYQPAYYQDELVFTQIYVFPTKESHAVTHTLSILLLVATALPAIFY